MRTDNEHTADFVVVGNTVAAMRAAVQLAEAGHVRVLSKDDFAAGGQVAQGGIAAAMGEDDEVTLHFHDTLRAGDGLCHEEAVRALVEEAPRLIQELIEWGVRFDRSGTKLGFSSEGTHSRSRVLRAQGDSTGGEVLRALHAKARSLPKLNLQCHALPVELLVEAGRVTGVSYLDEGTSSLRRVRAPAVLIATGGFGQVFKETTNPAAATGDGAAMAYRAGALLADMEFIVFHPTAIHIRGVPPLLMPEALRREGACLRNLELQRFMPRYHEGGELAPRDALSRSVTLEMQRGQSQLVYLDLTGLDAERVKKRFPRVYEACLRYNVDITVDLIPVHPAAHFAVGGIATDLSGASTLPGLYAAGEVASTRAHGASYLPSNSLLEDLVFGARAARAMIEGQGPWQPPNAPRSASTAAPAGAHPGHGHTAASGLNPSRALDATRAMMWEKVGPIRQGQDLREAVRWLDSVSAPQTGHASRAHCEQLALLDVACLIARCALAREESRGVHYRSDFPLRRDSPGPRHSFIARDLPVYFA